MDPGAVAEAARTQPQQLLTAEALQAALAALLPCAPAGATQLLSVPSPHTILGQTLQVQQEQLNSTNHQPKRKVARPAAEEPPGPAALPRPPPIKHEVYEDLEEKFNQLQSEREPKRHRGNPKGYQIKSFCKNPGCGKQLNGGRTNRCEHCGFDLASHRRNAQLERLIKSGPLTHAQVRTSLRDAANEVHVRTGGKAVVLTLVYIEGGGPSPAQAIAYGKPAAAFVENRKELITNFEAMCRDHFKEQQGPNAAAIQQQSNQQPLQPLTHNHQLGANAPQLGISPPLLGPQVPAASAPSTASAAARPCSLGPSSQLLSAVNAAAVAAAAAVNGAGSLPLGSSAPGMPLVAAVSTPPAPPVDLEFVIASTLADPAAAIARCRDARISGEVLARLPQAMQLTVLMQAGLLAGEAASVVVELESRQRLQNIPALSLTALSQQLSQQQHHSSTTAAATVPLQPAQIPPLLLQPLQPAAGVVPAVPQQPGGPLALQHQVPTQQTWAAGVVSVLGPGATSTMPGAAISGGLGPVAGGLPPYHHPEPGDGVVPGEATATAAAAAAAETTPGDNVPLLGSLHAALMAAVAVGPGAVVDGVLGQSPAVATAATTVVTTVGHGGSQQSQQQQQQQQVQGMLGIVQGGLMPAVARMGPDLVAGRHSGVQATGQLPGHSHPQALQPQL